VEDEIAEDFEWMQGTEWKWKEREWTGKVNFEPDGVFRAETQDCQRGGCKWTAQNGKIYIMWGQSGLHVMMVKKMEPVAGNRMSGRRKKGRAKCSATFIRRDASGVTRNPYTVLGVDEDATDKDIKRSYRKLSIKYHPDKNRGNDEAVARFNEVRGAYEVLSDPDKKILYDTGGMKAVKEAEKEDATGAQQNPFGMMFGGQQQQQKKRKAKKGPDAQAPISVTLATMYNGETVHRQIERRIVCRGCKGKAALKKEKCKKCGPCPASVKNVLRPMGNGMMVQQQVQVASKWRCRKELTSLAIEVERGMAQGSQITHQRMHDQTPGMIPGDVIFVLQQAANAVFTRKGDDLHMKMEISLKEALIGFSRTITHLDGHTVNIDRTAVTIPNQRIRVENEGMPVHTVPSQFGSLIVTVHVSFPRSLTAAQTSAFQEML
jgi:DnaJ-class molecular chaperone